MSRELRTYSLPRRGGIHELVDIETVRAVADTVAELHDDLDAGGGVSGPASRRAIKAAATAPTFVGTVITAKTARRLIANEDALLYDNPHALLLCHYKRDRALCHRGGVKDTPSLDHCVPGCGNILAPTPTPPSCASGPASSTSALPTSPVRWATGSAATRPSCAVTPTTTTAPASPCTAPTWTRTLDEPRTR